MVYQTQLTLHCYKAVLNRKNKGNNSQGHEGFKEENYKAEMRSLQKREAYIINNKFVKELEEGNKRKRRKGHRG
jgi:hypothetical protein